MQSGLPLGLIGDRPIEAAQPLRRKAQLAAKRIFDLAFALMALIALSPFMVFVALAIKATSPGPIFFSQEREGLDGARFTTLKFRSMRVDAGDPSGLKQTTRNDPRITAVGALIRRTSVDELPQLFNVLSGEMSLVGPRPHVVGMLAAGMPYKALVPYYDDRLKMRPGITGWAQANGLRGITSEAALAQARVNHDLAYIQNYSFMLDIRTILLTVRNEFLSGTGH